MKRPGVVEFGEAAKESQAPEIRFPVIKAIPESIAREENLEKLFMRSDQWPPFDSLAPDTTIHPTSSRARPAKSSLIINIDEGADCFPTTNTA